MHGVYAKLLAWPRSLCYDYGLDALPLATSASAVVPNPQSTLVSSGSLAATRAIVALLPSSAVCSGIFSENRLLEPFRQVGASGAPRWHLCDVATRFSSRRTSPPGFEV